jgi:DNA-binding transcriptional LysR family regulator
MHANNMGMLQAAALAGSGIVYGPTFVFGVALSEGTLVQVLANYITASLPIHAVFPTARYMPRIVRKFVDRLAEDFGGVPPWERWDIG